VIKATSAEIKEGIEVVDTNNEQLSFSPNTQILIFQRLTGSMIFSGEGT